MTKREAARQNAQEAALLRLGFTTAEAEQLRRISMTLHRWHELECGTDSCCLVRGAWNKDTGSFDYADTGAPYYEFAGGSGRARYSRTPDRETGARKRLAAILTAHAERIGIGTNGNGDIARHPNGKLRAYIQTDPRGAALYLLQSDDVPEGKADESYYTRGLCIY